MTLFLIFVFSIIVYYSLDYVAVIFCQFLLKILLDEALSCLLLTLFDPILSFACFINAVWESADCLR